MDSILNSLWVEKYRPSKLDDLVLESSIRTKLEELLDRGEIPHLLFCGKSGIGKTSLAKILVSELGWEYMNINASDEGGIDTIRTKVKSFASNATFDDKPKVVIFGEADGLSKSAQDSLKEIIELTSDTTRFIFTANDLSKLSEPIVSRCQSFDLKYSYKDFVVRCINILKEEGIKCSNKKLITDICKGCYPDFRHAIHTMQRNTTGGVLETVEEDTNGFVQTLWENINTSKPEEVRKFYIENMANFTSYQTLMVEMAEYAFDNFEAENSRNLILLLNKYLVQDTAVVDEELNFYCLIIELTMNK